MGLQMPAALAALGLHKILKLGNLFVEAIDVLVKKPIKQLSINKESSASISPTWVPLAGRAGKELLAEVRAFQTDQKGLLGFSKLWSFLWAAD